MERRSVVSPPVLGLELRRQLQQEVLTAVGADELHADRESLRRSAQRE